MMRLPVITMEDFLAEEDVEVREIKEDHHEAGVGVRTLILMIMMTICLGVVVVAARGLAVDGLLAREMILATGGPQTLEAVGMIG